RNIHYYKQFSLARSGSIKNLQNNQYKIEVLTQISQKKKDEISAIQNEYAIQRKNLEQEKNKHQIMLSQISDQITQQQQEINKLENDEKRIANLVKAINKLLVQEKSKNTLINNKLPDASTAGASFASLKGKLNLPVRGKLMNSFGGQRSGKHVTWKGLFIQSPNGSDVKAISAGRVVFADWLRGFGHLVILDHGNGYMSLYGNNETLHKQVGDPVRGGDTIATVGNSGSNTDSGLYFELRHRGKPFDPLTWIKIE
ncbi:MAG: peptidoglycan DD-metalloendopeptidase family protein, partial [Pseudomonadota bacterium]